MSEIKQLHLPSCRYPMKDCECMEKYKANCDEWELSASMACQEPCGDCAGCNTAAEIMVGTP